MRNVMEFVLLQTLILCAIRFQYDQLRQELMLIHKPSYIRDVGYFMSCIVIIHRIHNLTPISSKQ
jgi:hypothetical protein